MFTIDIATAIGIVLSGVASFWGLIKYLRGSDLKALEQMSKRVEFLERKVQDADIKAAEAAVKVSAAEDCRRRVEGDVSKLEVKHEGDVKAIFGHIKEMQETHADIRETVAGFDGKYVSRKEYLDDRAIKKHAQ